MVRKWQRQQLTSTTRTQRRHDDLRRAA